MTAQLSLAGFAEKPLSAERLYLAILPDTPARTTIERITGKEIQDRGLTAIPVRPEHLHITLCWIDDFSGGLPKNIVERTKEAAARIFQPQFDATFDRVASFGSADKKPLVLLGGDELNALKAFRLALFKSLKTYGPLCQARPGFTPHVTLLRDDLTVDEHTVEAVRWTVKEFVLIRSILGKNRHEHLAKWGLQG